MLVLASMVTATTPNFPHVVEGDITVNDDSSYEGEIQARHAGSVMDFTQIEDGVFGSETDPLAVSGLSDGDTIKFYVDGIELDNTASFESGKVSNLSLDLTTSSDVPTKVSNRVSEAQKSSGQIDVKVPEAASKENSGVEDIRITVNQDAENREINEVNITVSNKVEENQGEVGDIPVGDQENNVHGNIDVDTDNNDAVESSRINFRVRKDRIGDTSEVVLFHYDERELIEALDTNYLEDKTEGRSDDYYYFESDTTSFSSFTIASDNQDPDAEIDVNSTDIQAGDTVEFDSSDSSDAETEIRSYDWNFGGGEGSDSGQKVSHTYDEEGDYTVVLTVTDQGGNEDTSTVEISVEDIQTGSSNSQDTVEEEPEQQEQNEETQQDQTESEQDTSSSQDGNDQTESDTGSDNQQSDQDTETSEAETEEVDQNEQQNTQTPTGLFTAENGGLAGVVLLVLAGTVFYANRTGRIDLAKIKSILASKLARKSEESSDYKFN